MHAWVMVLSVVLAGAEPAPEGVSLAVFPLEAQGGVDPTTATLVTDALLAEVKSLRRFERVVSSADLRAVVGLERERQMLDCTSTSCLAEVAGSLGVSFIAVGSIGRLGQVFQLSLKLVEARSGQLTAAVTRRCGGSVDVVVNEMAPAVRALLTQAGLWKGPPDDTATRNTAADVATTASSTRTPWPVAVAAGGAGVVALLGITLAVVLAGVAVGAAVLPYVVYLPAPSGSYAVRFVFTRSPVAAALMGGALGLVLALAGGVSAAGLGARFMMMRGGQP